MARGEAHVEMVFNDIGEMPTYMREMLLKAMVVLGVKNPSVTFEVLPNGHTKFDATW